MTEKVITIGSGVDVKVAARLMLKKKIGCLPVVDGGELVGLISESDVIRIVAES
jgi:acetoin utilization protein AcuB